jgi:phage tail sheath protein FI
MPLPDVVVNIGAAAPSRTLPTDTGVCFAVGQTERGDATAPVKVTSLSGFVAEFGSRLVTSSLYDFVETYFAEGGSVLYVSRVFGSGALAATRNLNATATPALIVNAIDPGTWGNSLSVGVVAGAQAGEFVIVVQRNAVEVERSYSLVDTAAAIAWARTNSAYISITQGASTSDPDVAAPAALSGGTDGSAIVDADWQLALDRISSELGPGQVCAPGRTTTAGHLQVIAHAVARNRFALLDPPDTSTVATLITTVSGAAAAPANGRRRYQMFAPWEVIPGLTPTTLRTIPPSARAAAQYARVDALGNPNKSAAGVRQGLGVARYVLDLSQPAFSDADRQTLNEAGITVSRRRYGTSIVTWGLRSGADQNNDSNWSFASNVRCVMRFIADAQQVGDAHEFDQVDGAGTALSEFRGELIAKANALFLVGALYGQTPQEAFYVDTGPQINSDASLAQGIMRAAVALRTSPGAERVIIDVVKVPITQSLV